MKPATMRRTVVFLIALLKLCGLYADESFYITDVKAQQRYPWNDKVDIVVKIKGDVEQISRTECLFCATNSETNVAVPVSDISQVGIDVIDGDVCTRNYLWNASNDVGAVKIKDLAFAVVVQNKLIGVQLWENGPYWAEWNVGATKPEESGYYFWWGDTVGYKLDAGVWVSSAGTHMSSSPFVLSNCSTMYKDETNLLSLGYIDSTGNLVATHDAATVHLGAQWRMPTEAEMNDLFSHCNQFSTTINGVFGLLLTGCGAAYAANSIFLPAVSLYSGNCGCYWSSTPSSYSTDAPVFFTHPSNYVHSSPGARYLGMFIRPVRVVLK